MLCVILPFCNYLAGSISRLSTLGSSKQLFIINNKCLHDGYVLQSLIHLYLLHFLIYSALYYRGLCYG